MPNLLLALLAVALLGCSPGTSAVPTLASSAATIERPSVAPGTKRLLRGTPASPVRLLVQESEFGMEQRALQEGSLRGPVNPEIVNVTAIAEVTILQATRDGVQVQVNEGPQAGRRGWIRTDHLSQ